jgi:lipopolysaccharide transport protein LptA
MRSIRAARAVVLVFLALFAAAILYAVWRAPDTSPAMPAPRPVPEAPEEMPVAGPVESAAETFLFTEEKAGIVVTRLRAGKMLGIEGGSRVLSDILIELRPNPETDPDEITRIRGEAGRFDAAAHEVILRGAVELRTATGEELHAEILRYRVDERRARSDGPVRFSLGESSGTARGLDADLVRRRLKLASEVVLEILSAGDEASTRVCADSLDHDGTSGDLRLGGAIEIEGAWGVFQGRDLFHRPGEAGGSVGVSNAPGSLRASTGDRQRLVLEAERWRFDFDETRRIQAVVASHRARLEPLADPTSPLEELVAERIRFEPAETPDSGVRLEAFSQGGAPVEARLREAALSSVTASRLSLVTIPPEGQVAVFRGDVRASGPARTAIGHELRLREDGSAVLGGSPAEPAQATEATHAVTAQRIVFREDGSGAARGDVRIDVHTGSAEGRERLAAVADEADFLPKDDTLRLRGRVRAWQGEDTLEAEWLRLERNRGRLVAGGGVVTSIRSGAESGGLVRASERIQVRAASLVWERPLSRAIFTGDVRMVQGAAEMSADRLELEGAENGQRRLVAEGSVSFEDPDWLGGGDRLTYGGQPDTYVLESDDALAWVISKSSGGRLRGRTLRVNATGEAVLVEGRQGGRVTIRAGQEGETR